MKVRQLKNRFYKKDGGPRGIGLRCKEYCAGCIVCESYKFYDEQGRFPTFDEVQPIARENAEKEHRAWLLTDEGKAWLAKNAKKRKETTCTSDTSSGTSSASQQVSGLAT